MAIEDTTESEEQRPKWWRVWACACRRKPWEKSDVDCVRRRILDVFRWVFYAVSLLIIVILICAFCIFLFSNSFWEELCLWIDDNGFSFANCLYFMYAVFLLTAIMHFWGTFERAKFLPRVQDRHYVQSLLDSGKHASSKMKKPENCSAQGMLAVVEKLQKKLDNNESIVEYDLLHLKILLVDCASGEEVKAQADTYLVDLEDLADEEAHTHQTKEEYWDIRHQVESFKEKINSRDESLADNLAASNSSEIDREGERSLVESLRGLRAVVTERLLPTVTENEKLWVEGSAIVNMLRYACLASIPLLLAAGTIPGYPGGDSLDASANPDASAKLMALNWAILGVAGALVAVLRALGHTDRLEVGNQLGVREVQRTWWGAGLGLVAGFLAYMLVASGFIECYLFQDCTLKANKSSFFRHVLLAFLAGYAFERTLDRVRAATGT